MLVAAFQRTAIGLHVALQKMAEDQAPAAEIRAVGIRQRDGHARIDQLRAVIFGDADGGGQAFQLRRAVRPVNRAFGPEEPQVDAAAAAVLARRGLEHGGHDAAAEPGQAGVLLVARCHAVDLGDPARGIAVGPGVMGDRTQEAAIGVVRRRAFAVLVGMVVPGDGEPACAVGDDRPAAIGRISIGIDRNLSGSGGAVGIEDPRHDPVIVAVAVARPQHGEAAVRQRGDLGLVLAAGGGNIDQEGRDRLVAVRIEDPREDAVAVAAAVAAPDRHRAVPQRRQHRRVLGLVVDGPGEREFPRPHGRPVRLVDLGADFVIALVGCRRLVVGAPVVVPGHHDRAVRQHGQRRLALVVRGQVVHLRIGTERHQVGGEPGEKYAAARAVPGIAVGIGQHDVAVAVERDLGVGLAARGNLVQAHFLSQPLPRSGEALREDAVARAVRACRSVDHDEIAGGQRQDPLLALVAVNECVNLNIGRNNIHFSPPGKTMQVLPQIRFDGRQPPPRDSAGSRRIYPPLN